MAPRDPMEGMLGSQAVRALTRVLRVTDLANRRTTLDGMKTVNGYADRASNTSRRLMLALAEWRRPPRAGETITAIQQANIAGQQAVMNGEPKEKNATSEQGSSPGAGTRSPVRAVDETRPADTGVASL